MKTPIRTYKTAELYMQQGYFEEARDVLRALEAENPSDPSLPGLYRRLEELIQEAEINPPVQQLERNEEYGAGSISLSGVQATVPSVSQHSQSQNCCSASPTVQKNVSAPAGSRTQRLVTAAADVGIDVAQRAVTGFVKRLNRVITRIQERKGGL